MPFPTAAREYLFNGLEATPVLLESLIGGLPEDAPAWDKRPDPDRFTLREALAHLADWEAIWLERLTKISSGERPFLPSVDETALCAERAYACASPRESLARYEAGRERLLGFLRSASEEEWDFAGDRELVGVLTLQQQAYFALTHDLYHLRQVAECLRA